MATILAEHWRQVLNVEWKWPHFLPQEMACRGSGKLLLDTDLLDKLEMLRAALGNHPMVVTSGYRTPAHNKAVGGAPKSQHLLGRAVDISMANWDPEMFVAKAKVLGFNGIGLYPERTMVHLDIRDAPATWGTPFSLTPTRLPTEQPMPKPVMMAHKEEVRGALAATLVTVGGGVVAQGLDLPVDGSYFLLGGFIVVVALIVKHLWKSG